GRRLRSAPVDQGRPSEGKTMLIIPANHERQRHTSSMALSYFLCQGTDENRANAAAGLRGFIYTLCHRQPLPCVASPRSIRPFWCKASLKIANSFYALSNVLKNILPAKQ